MRRPIIRSPDHPIIDRPWEYVVTELHYRAGLGDSMEKPTLDLTLARGSVTRRLRFLEPRNLQIEPGFPNPTHGMCILDARDRQLDRVRVEVADFEAGQGAITFLAYDVIDLDVTPPA